MSPVQYWPHEILSCYSVPGSKKRISSCNTGKNSNYNRDTEHKEEQ